MPTCALNNCNNSSETGYASFDFLNDPLEQFIIMENKVNETSLERVPKDPKICEVKICINILIISHMIYFKLGSLQN